MEEKGLSVVCDVDETITAWPRFFSWLTRALVRDGHHVTILTVRRDRAETAQLLERYGIVFDALETPPSSTGDALAWKIARARALASDVLFDDSVEVVNALPSRTCAMLVRDHALGSLEYEISDG